MAEKAEVQGIKKMKAACQLAARVLQHAGTLVKVGQQTQHPVQHTLLLLSSAACRLASQQMRLTGQYTR